jgi:hypothetical protein
VPIKRSMSQFPRRNAILVFAIHNPIGTLQIKGTHLNAAGRLTQKNAIPGRATCVLMEASFL